MSYRGVFLRTDTPPAPRQLVTLKLVLPPGDRALTVHGMTVHVVEPGNAADRTPGIGVQFYGLDHERRETWEAFVRVVEKSCPESADQVPLVMPDGTPEPLRRKFPRHTAVLKVQVATVIDLFELLSRDLSRNGMFIETQHELKVGTDVIVNVHHPERSDTFLLDAIVRRCVRGPVAGVGVEFVRMDTARRDEFIDFVRGGIHVDEDAVRVDADDQARV